MPHANGSRIAHLIASKIASAEIYEEAAGIRAAGDRGGGHEQYGDLAVPKEK